MDQQLALAKDEHVDAVQTRDQERYRHHVSLACVEDYIREAELLLGQTQN